MIVLGCAAFGIGLSPVRGEPRISWRGGLQVKCDIIASLELIRNPLLANDPADVPREADNGTKPRVDVEHGPQANVTKRLRGR
jgi:hypothetical protein